MGDAAAARKPRASKTTASTIALLASNVSPWNASTTLHTSKPQALTSDNAASSVFRRSFGTLDASCRSEIKSATAFLHALRSCGVSGLGLRFASGFGFSGDAP